MTCTDIPIFRQDIISEILNMFKTVSTQRESSSHIDQIFDDLIVEINELKNLANIIECMKSVHKLASPETSYSYGVSRRTTKPYVTCWN